MVKAKQEYVAKPSKFEYTEPWHEFTLGASVKVTRGFWSNKTGIGWTFKAHCRNIYTGQEWLELHMHERGSGHESIRSIPIDSVELIPAKKPKRKYTKRVPKEDSNAKPRSS